MRKLLLVLSAIVLSVSVSALAVGRFPAFAEQPTAQPGKSMFKANLKGFSEVPAIVTTGKGSFRATLNASRTAIDYELSYSDLRSPAQAAHIHLGQKDVNGGVIAFLCGGGGKPACPPESGTVTGTITAADVTGPTGQGMDPGDFASLLRAMRAGVTYVNVHSTMFPGGEIRGQVR